MCLIEEECACNERLFTHLDSNLLLPQAHECSFFSCVVMCVRTYLAFFLATSLIATPTWFADGFRAGHNFFLTVQHVSTASGPKQLVQLQP